jgi:formate dehydrogenase subunit delta
MKDQDLIRMANQIAQAFATYPEDQAVSETGTHIRKFWEPRMRRQISQYVTNGAEGLNPVAVKAIKALPEPIEFKPN